MKFNCLLILGWLVAAGPGAGLAQSRPTSRFEMRALMGSHQLMATQPEWTSRSGVTWVHSDQTMLLNLTTWQVGEADFERHHRFYIKLTGFRGRPGTYKLTAKSGSEASYAGAGVDAPTDSYQLGDCQPAPFVLAITAIDPARRLVRGTFSGPLCRRGVVLPVRAGVFSCHYIDWNQ